MPENSPTPSAKPHRPARMTVSGVILIAALFCLILFAFQERLIYFPRPYPVDFTAEATERLEEITYSTSSGQQTAFFLRPSEGELGNLTHVWILFGGNASLALSWLDLIIDFPDKQSGFLLIDYPGYGKCQGKPSRESIRESALEAFAELSKKLNAEPKAISLSLIGHSIGAGAALDFAVRSSPRRIVLVAPFTSLRDMAKRVVGWPLCYLLRGNFDNAARLAEMSAQAAPPSIHIIHGSDDEVIPVWMSRKLKELFPKLLSYDEVPGATHNTILDSEKERIVASMLAN